MKSILLVDDEPAANDVGVRLLEYLGYDVTALSGSPEALAVFRERPHAFDLVITDYMMPDMKGDELARRLHGIRRDIPVVLCTGYGDIPEPVLEKWGIDALLVKPYRIRDVACLVRGLLGGNGQDPVETPAPASTRQADFPVPVSPP